MAEGGNSNIQKSYNKLIEEETSGDESNDIQYEEETIEGDEAAILCHFKSTDLTELAVNYHCKITRKPPNGLVRTLVIAFKPKYRKKIATYRLKMKLELKKLEVRQFTFNRDKSRMLSEYLSSSERLEDKVCYIPDIVNNSVDIVGRSYDEISKADHRLKVHLGEITVTRSKRIGRQTSDPGEMSNESDSRLEPKASSETVKAKINTGKNKGFAKSYSGRESSRQSIQSADDFCFETTLNNGFLLKVYKGSVTNLEVEVIVNAANNNMVHGGGVARVISRAAGWKLDDESSDHVTQHGNVDVTENIVTTAGNLTQYKAVIHAVGPMWRDYRNKTDCVDALGDCVYNVLETCTKHKFRTVAMPAISAGIFGVPKELCADMYVDATARFSKHLQPEDCPKELHIVDIDTSILKFVEVSVKKWQKDPQSVNSRVTLPKFLEENPHLAKSSNVNQDDVRGQRGQGGGQRGQVQGGGQRGQVQGEGQRGQGGCQRDQGRVQGGGQRGQVQGEGQRGQGGCQRDQGGGQRGRVQGEGQRDQGGGQRDQGGGVREKRSEQGQNDARDYGGKPTRQATKQDESPSNRYSLKNTLKYVKKETFKWGGQADVFEMGQKITIKIFKGDVTKAQNMDAVVCCMDKYFIAAGFVAEALRKVGGKDYEKNFSKMKSKYKLFASKGSVYKCRAGGLGVHHVLHVIMDSMTAATDEEVRFYKECIYKVLSKADEWEHAKLVIPLFGTGFTKPDRLKATCVAVLRGIDQYMSDRSKGRVTDIHLVNKDEKVCKLLIEVFNDGVNTPASFRSGYLELGAGSSRRKEDENQNTGKAVWYLSRDQHEGVERGTTGDRYENHESREKFGYTDSERFKSRSERFNSGNEKNNSGSERFKSGSETFNSGSKRMSTEGQYEEDRLSDGRYEGHGRRKHDENRSRRVNEADFQGKHLQGAAVNDEDSGESGNSGSEMNTKPSTPPRQERKQTGNLKIIEN